MSRYAEAVKRLLAAAIIGGVAYFFYRALRQNWGDIQAAKLRFDYPLLLAAAVTTLIYYLLATFAWHRTVNRLSETRQLTLSQSVAAMNASGLTKYLPGKFWSYALQAYWLGGAGFSKSLVVFANLLNLAVASVTALLLGALCLVLAPTKISPVLCWSALLALLVADAALILFYEPVFSLLSALAKRAFKREIGFFRVPIRLSLELHALHFSAAIITGVATYLVCLGVGYTIGPSDVMRVVAAAVVADVAGLLAVIAPGGLGVREGVMFLILDGISLASLPLVLPIATRSVNLLVDIVLGAVALALLRKHSAQGWSSP